jgi:hypothetical protein
MKDDSRMRTLMATALVLALAAMLAGPAGARPIDGDGTAVTSTQAQAARPDDKGGPLGVGAIGTEQTSPATGTQAPQPDGDSGWRGTSTFGVAMAGALLAAMALLAVRRRHNGSIVT